MFYDLFYHKIYTEMNLNKLIKNKFTWIIIIFLFLAYQIIPELLTYERMEGGVNTITEKNIDAASKSGGKSQ